MTNFSNRCCYHNNFYTTSLGNLVMFYLYLPQIYLGLCVIYRILSLYSNKGSLRKQDGTSKVTFHRHQGRLNWNRTRFKSSFYGQLQLEGIFLDSSMNPMRDLWKRESLRWSAHRSTCYCLYLYSSLLGNTVTNSQWIIPSTHISRSIIFHCGMIVCLVKRQWHEFPKKWRNRS